MKDVFDYKYEIQNATVNGHCNEVSQWLRKAGGNLHIQATKKWARFKNTSHTSLKLNK